MDKKVQLKDFENNNVFPKTQASLLINDDGSKYNVPKPDTKTDAQTQGIGIDSNGKLWTTPGTKVIANKNSTSEGLPELITLEIDGINYTLESPLPFSLSDVVPVEGTLLQQIVVGEDVWKIHDFATTQDIDELFQVTTTAEEVIY